VKALLIKSPIVIAIPRTDVTTLDSICLPAERKEAAAGGAVKAKMSLDSQKYVFRRAFLVLLFIFFIIFLFIIKSFLLPGVFSILIAIIADPIYQFLLKTVRNHRYIAAFLATTIVSLCVVIPFTFILVVIASNITEVIRNIIEQLESGQLAHALDSANIWLRERLSFVSAILPIEYDTINMREMLLSTLKAVGKDVYGYSSGLVKMTVSIVAGLVLTVILIFTFFAEGSAILKYFLSLIPLSEEHKNLLTRETRQVISGTFLGMIATAFAQGFLSGVAYWLVGFSNPSLWALVGIVVTLIPVIGGPTMYVPASIGLFLTGSYGKAIFLFLFGVGIISTVDNIIKPLIMRGKVDVHPVLLGLCLIGGGLWAGLVGIVIGPLVAALMLAMLRAYKREFEYANQQ
jgi:predicted PurR-regulated permease PerM